MMSILSRESRVVCVGAKFLVDKTPKVSKTFGVWALRERLKNREW